MRLAALAAQGFGLLKERRYRSSRLDERSPSSASRPPSCAPDAISRRACPRSSERPTVSAPEQPAAVQIEDDERALVGGAPDDLGVPLVRGPDVLDRGPVGQIGEEVRHDVVVDAATEHVARRRPAVVERHVPVLDADPPTVVDDAHVLGYVTGGEHALGRGLEFGVQRGSRPSRRARGPPRGRASRRARRRRRPRPRRPRARGRPWSPPS